MSTPSMLSKSKLSEARYFLENLARQQEPETVLYNLSAFQNASYSVMQFMLYDFAEKLGLSVTRAEWLDVDKFNELAKSKMNKKAEEFAEWWQRKDGELASDVIWKSRRVITHRGYPELHQETNSVYISGFSSPDVSDPRFVAAMARSGSFTTWGTPAVGRTGEVRAEKVFTLTEAPSASVIETCRTLYKKLVTIVGEAEMSFWAPP